MINGAGAIKQYDLLGFSIAAVDDVAELASFPQPGCKMPILAFERHGGGQCTTALVTAARLGLRCYYAGILGDNELSAFTRSILRREGVQFSETIIDPQASPYHSIVLVDRGSGERTILHAGEGVTRVRPEDIGEEMIAASRVLFVDHLSPQAVLHACRIACRLGVPIVADLERIPDPTLLEAIALIDHLIVPMRLAKELTGQDDPTLAVTQLAMQSRACTAVTHGARGCWFIAGDDAGGVHHQPAFKVQVKDTTGCGDVFHGAYAAALVFGMPVVVAIHFASAAAALKAIRLGGQQGIPDRAAIEHFLDGGEKP